MNQEICDTIESLEVLLTNVILELKDIRKQLEKGIKENE